MRRREFICAIGGAAAWPLAATAQQKAMPVIGYLSPGASGLTTARVAAVIEGLRQNGYVEGQNLRIEYRWAEGHYDRLPGLAAGLVERSVDLIVASTPPSAFVAKGATTSIPIVFSVGVDPVAAGLVASLRHPGGNLTGVAILFSDLTPKRLELLTDLAPTARTVAFLVGPETPTQAQAAMHEASRAKGLQLLLLSAKTADEIDDAFATLAQHRVDALVIGDDPFSFQRPGQIVTSAAHYAVPTIYYSRSAAAGGGLISYGPDLVSTYRQVGIYAGRILKGEKPADLPVQQPTRFELVVNLKTAKALGLTVPQTILARADEVIE
jgi:putative ABC transport system substrate-binding protein